MTAPRPKILDGRAIVPGLLNAHSHSFQRAIRGRTEHRTAASRDTFWTWREAMYHAANRLSPEDIYDVARMAFLEMLLAGITTVREFHYLHNAPDGSRYDDPNLLAGQVIRAAREVGLRIELLRTAYQRAGWQQPVNPLQARFITPSAETFIKDTEKLRRDFPDASIGIAPHSVRALPLSYLLEVVEYARANQLSIDMHVSEQPAEVDACLAEYGLRPLQLLHERGVLDRSFTGVHAIHITQEEIKYLGRAKARVCACPTTERNLGDGTVPAAELLAAGVSICFGSDSNVQIDVLEDARSLEYHLRMKHLERCILPAEQLFAAAVGSTPPEDYFTLDLNDPSMAGTDEGSLLPSIVFCVERTAMRDVFVNGVRLVQDGHHPLEEEIVSRFAAVQRRLWR